MPTLAVPSLSIGGLTNGRRAVDISFVVNLEPEEFFRIFFYQIEIWGADKGFNGKDECLFRDSRIRFNSPGRRTTLRRQLNIRNATLDEDKQGRDELYATVTVEPGAEGAYCISPIFTANISS